VLDRKPFAIEKAQTGHEALFGTRIAGLIDAMARIAERGTLHIVVGFSQSGTG
jgi:hypothetical protein